MESALISIWLASLADEDTNNNNRRMRKIFQSFATWLFRLISPGNVRSCRQLYACPFPKITSAHSDGAVRKELA